MLDFRNVTACGQCCNGCLKKEKGTCRGCIITDGVVPGKKERCKIHECARNHGVQFCGQCSEFPCAELPKLVPWEPEIVEHMADLKREYDEKMKK